MILFSPIAPFPGYLSEKLGLMKRGTVPIKLFTIWGNRNRRGEPPLFGPQPQAPVLQPAWGLCLASVASIPANEPNISMGSELKCPSEILARV